MFGVEKIFLWRKTGLEISILKSEAHDGRWGPGVIESITEGFIDQRHPPHMPGKAGSPKESDVRCARVDKFGVAK